MTDFQTFWNLYPRRKGKGAARKAWEKAARIATPEDIMAGLEANLSDITSREPQYQPHPATWLNQERWEDEPDDTPERPLHSKPYDDWTDDEKRHTAEFVEKFRGAVESPLRNMGFGPLNDIEQRLKAEGYLENEQVRARNNTVRLVNNGTD